MIRGYHQVTGIQYARLLEMIQQPSEFKIHVGNILVIPNAILFGGLIALAFGEHALRFFGIQPAIVKHPDEILVGAIGSMRGEEMNIGKMRRGQPVKSIHQTIEQVFQFVNNRIIARLGNAARKIPVKFFRLFEIKTLTEAKYKRTRRVYEIKQEIVQRLVGCVCVFLEELARQQG